MTQLLLCQLTKSRLGQEYIKGPAYDLSREQMKRIVEYLKSTNHWNYTFMHETDAIVESDILVNELNVFDRYTIDENYQYSLDIGDVGGYFCEGWPPRETTKKYLSIVGTKKNAEIPLFHHFIDQKYTKFYLEKFPDLQMTPSPVKLEQADADAMMRDKNLYNKPDLDFNKFNLYLHWEDPWNYVVESNEDWIRYQ